MAKRTTEQDPVLKKHAKIAGQVFAAGTPIRTITIYSSRVPHRRPLTPAEISELREQGAL